MSWQRDEDEDDARVAGRQQQSEGAYEEPNSDDLTTLHHGRSVEPATQGNATDSEEEEGLLHGEYGMAAVEKDGMPAVEGEGEEAAVEMVAEEEEMDGGCSRKDEILNEHLVDFGKVETAGNGHTRVLELWAEFEVPLNVPRILFVPLVEELAEGVLVKSTPGIHSASVMSLGSKQNQSPAVQTAGVNFEVLAEMADLVDLAQVQSNHVHAILNFYGVEAARAAIVNEIRSVFAVYGISVDPRHLGLIADYMTHEGSYKALNRHGAPPTLSTFPHHTLSTKSFMETQAEQYQPRVRRVPLASYTCECARATGISSEPSPLLKMSFETTMGFLTEAGVAGDVDSLCAARFSNCSLS